MYSKAHQALDYALTLTYGSCEETFKLLPYFRYVMEQQSLGTITDIQCMEDNKFLYFFMAIVASIIGFWRCIRLVIVVDSTFLKGRCRGTVFLATTQVDNKQAYLIAFGYGDPKNNTYWEWFLDCLKGALGHIKDLVFISDRHLSIEAGIASVFPYATHTICAWHFSENIRKCFHRKDVGQIMFGAAKSY
ncbi:hypothetical protein Dsin_017098 [Dipteronia sinensis]|uniref:MULE transposase domain-containing protein n=1 Tax=Dipteronia sinensis TaxID=43782 RepID=A0AAE0E6D5_9ROSI|nr:hypothetical protein Dsin_017098 [Dipteronia sinensis]